MKFRIAQKGVILVGIPLAFELITFSVMLGLVDQSEHAARQAQFSRQVIAITNVIGTDAIELVRTLEGTSPLHIDEMKIQAQISFLQQDVSRFREIVKGDTRFKDQTQGFEDMLARVENGYRELVPLYKSGRVDLLTTRLKAYREFYRELATHVEMLKRVKEFARDESEIVEAEPARQAVIRQRTKLMLEACLFLSIAISIFSALIFSRQITLRIRTIIDNNMRLTSGTPLHPRIGGSDEISDVDHAFHDMSHALKLAKERELEVQRLRDRIVAMVSHDLRTPLQNFSTFLELVEAEVHDEKLKRLQATAIRNVERMNALVKDLLDLDKIRSGNLLLDRQLISLSEAAYAAVDAVRGLAQPKNAAIVVEGDASIYADRSRIIQVLTNLLTNAVKYCDPDSDILVRVQSDPQTATISVTDTGREICADALDSIFEPFQQLNANDATQLGGFGLGLAICKHLIELHGGTIVVRSDASTTQFTVTIPSCPGALSNLCTQPASQTA